MFDGREDGVFWLRPMEGGEDVADMRRKSGRDLAAASYSTRPSILASTSRWIMTRKD